MTKYYKMSEPFNEKVMDIVELLSSTGKTYRKKIYKINDILQIYIDDMITKWLHMGEKYVRDMINNIKQIFINISLHSKYDKLEFVNSIITYSFKKISYKYTKLKKIPTLPDYTISEIKDLAN